MGEHGVRNNDNKQSSLITVSLLLEDCLLAITIVAIIALVDSLLRIIAIAAYFKSCFYYAHATVQCAHSG